LPLSFGQERIWLLSRLEPEGVAFNMPAAVELRGSLAVSALAAALGEVVRRHESLRTVFEERIGELSQRVSPPLDVVLPLADLGGLPENRRAAEAARLAELHGHTPLDLRRGPPFATVLVRLGPRLAELEEKELAFWLERLGGEVATLDLPTDRPRPTVQTYRGGRVARVLEPELADSLRGLCTRQGATLLMVLLAGLAVVLQRW